jgi:hypothetical protein
MLACVNDKLVPHGFDEILKDNFRGVAPDVTATALMIGQRGRFPVLPFFDPRHSWLDE